MWPLIAFILLGIVIAALIEINERHKAKKSDDQRQALSRNDQCPTPSCSTCDLYSICDKEENQKKRQ